MIMFWILKVVNHEEDCATGDDDQTEDPKDESQVLVKTADHNDVFGGPL